MPYERGLGVSEELLDLGDGLRLVRVMDRVDAYVTRTGHRCGERPGPAHPGVTGRAVPASRMTREPSGWARCTVASRNTSARLQLVPETLLHEPTTTAAEVSYT